MDDSVVDVRLDEMPSPDGALELVAWESRRTVWIGIRPKGRRAVESPAQSAIGLHTGSDEHYVEATASIDRAWGVAFGAVAPEVQRVAIRNEQRELFPARIVPLPASFGEEFRAAWGIATRCERTCELIGYDERDRVITPRRIRTDERGPRSPGESLELIRQHCDNGLRYYAWALKRMPSIPEQAEHVPQVWNHVHALTVVLAYVEGATDERSAMLEAEESASATSSWSRRRDGSRRFTSAGPKAAPGSARTAGRFHTA